MERFPALAVHVHNHPAAFALLDLLDLKRGQLGAAQRTADQQSQDAVVALPFDGRAVRHGEQFPCLLPRQPIAQPSSLLPDIGHVGQLHGLLLIEDAVAPGFADQIAYCGEPDIDGRCGLPSRLDSPSTTCGRAAGLAAR
jgi:hypothetical protein